MATNNNGVSKAIELILKLSRITGIFPNTGNYKLTAILYLYSLLLALIICTAAFGTFLWQQYPDALLYDSLMHLAIEKAQKGILLTNYIVVLLFGIWYQKSFLDVLAELNNIDKILEELQMSMIYKLRGIAVVGLVKYISLCCLLVLDYFLSTESLWLYSLADLMSAHCPLIPIFAYELQFYSILLFIGDHFEFITDQLAVAINSNNYTGLSKIYHMIRIYDDLRRMSIEVNRMNSIVIIATVGSIFSLGIVNFHLLGTLGSYKRDLLISYLLGSFFLRIYELWNIIHPFVRISKQVDKFNAVLFKGMIQDRTGDLYKNERLYYHISKKRGITFSAYGFFPIDFTLIQSVAGAASTLLVILIQYSLSKTQLWCD